MGKSKILIASLLVSIAINLFFVGGIAYRMIGGPEFGPRPYPFNLSWIIRDLDESRQAELAPILERNRESSSQVRRRTFEAQRAVNELMSSETFDKAALDAAFLNLRTANAEYQTLSHQQTSEIIGLLTEEERTAAIQFVQRRGPREGFRNRVGDRFGSRPPREGSRGSDPRVPAQNNGDDQ